MGIGTDMSATILDGVRSKQNDYSALEEQFRCKTGLSLVLHPLEATRFRSIPSRSVSIIIPAWNVARSLRQCLRALAWSDYVARNPDFVQVIVVDDGSTDGSVETIEHFELPYRLLILRQPHQSRAHAMNAGFAFAEGEVLISCDADMLLSSFAVGEAVLRVDAEPRALYAGFRRDMPQDASAVSVDSITRKLPAEAFEFWGDNRFTYHWDGHSYPGWPRNMIVASGMVKLLGNGHAVILPDGDHWSLPRMVYGALFAFDRSWLQVFGGFDERFIGWGYEDTFFAAKAIAAGMFIVPLPSLSGVHLSHEARSHSQWDEGDRNRAMLNSLSASSTLEDMEQGWTKRARARVRTCHRGRRYQGKMSDRGADDFCRDVLELAEWPLWHLRYFAAQGLWHEAAGVAATAPKEVAAASPRIAAEAFRRAGALSLLECFRGRLPAPSPEVELEYAFALCEAGETTEALRVFRRLLASDVGHREVRYVTRGGPGKHLRRARRYQQMGLPMLMQEDLIGAFLSSGGNTPLDSSFLCTENRYVPKHARIL